MSMTMSELLILSGTVGGLILTVLILAFYLAHRSQMLVDRLTDKIMAERNPSAFATYGTVTPTLKEEQFPHSGNGKTPARTPGQEDLPSYMEIP